MYEFDPANLMLAQTFGESASPPPPGASTPPPGAGAAPQLPGGGQPLTGETAPGAPGTGTASRDPFGGMFFPLLLVLLITMITFTVLGQRRDKKKRAALLHSVKKHDRVQTVGGVIGSIVEVKTDTVVLKVDETSNTRITFARSAVQQVLDSGANGDKLEPPTVG